VRAWAGAVALSATLAGSSAGQGLPVSIGLAGGLLEARSRIAGADESLRGTTVGLSGRLEIGRVTVAASYLQGSLDPSGSGTAAARDYVEGRLLVGVTALPGLALRVGPHARAYITDSGTQRWLFWTLRARGERALVAPSITAFAEGWLSVSGHVNVTEPLDHARGGEVGMRVRLPRAPWWAQVAYGIERASLADGARLETVDGVVIAVGYGRR
jgi:hypothetical protein